MKSAIRPVFSYAAKICATGFSDAAFGLYQGTPSGMPQASAINAP
jgi:hypothetical protein